MNCGSPRQATGQPILEEIGKETSLYSKSLNGILPTY
jgi:hypothetical protein